MIDLDKELIPPKELIKDGSSSIASYLETGRRYSEFFRESLPLRPDMHVLEIGSSVGRISRQFINILSDEGRFTGIEVMPEPTAWCNENIGARFPWFTFIHADIYNSEYRPQGSIKASEYRFPFDDGALDLVILTSVFTHMLRNDVAHYLNEIGRILKPGGLCFATFFSYTLKEFSGIYSEDANPRFLFPIYKKGGVPLCMCADSEDLEEAVAYEKGFIDAMYADNGLTLQRYVPGGWVKREVASDMHQDIFIACK